MIMGEEIEEAAKEYSADRFFENDGNISNVREISFEAGAKWVLDNLWHDTSNKLPEDNEEVLGRYFFGSEDKSCHDDKIVYCQTNGKNWFTDFGGIAFDIGKPDMWMELPK